MSDLENLVPPLELCKMIPEGEFADSCFVRFGNKPYIIIERRLIRKDAGRKDNVFPAPTFDEILDELHKCQEDVFIKWSERAYHEWLVNAYSTGRNEDYQAHDESKVIAALKVWLKLKGIPA